MSLGSEAMAECGDDWECGDIWIWGVRAKEYSWDVLDSAYKSLQGAFTEEALEKCLNLTCDITTATAATEAKDSTATTRKEVMASSSRKKRRTGGKQKQEMQSEEEILKEILKELEKRRKEKPLRKAKDDLIQTWRSYSSDLFKKDVQKIHDKMPMAKQLVLIYYNYLRKIGFVKHDSNLESVMKNIPMARDFPLVKPWVVEYSVKKLIAFEKQWEDILWSARFAASIPKRSTRIQDKLSARPDLKILWREADYTELTSCISHDESPEDVIEHYSWYLKKHSHLGIEKAKAQYESQAKEELKEQEEIYMKTRPAMSPFPFIGPLGFLAKRELQGYKSKDNLSELLKIRTYFGRF